MWTNVNRARLKYMHEESNVSKYLTKDALQSTVEKPVINDTNQSNTQSHPFNFSTTTNRHCNLNHFFLAMWLPIVNSCLTLRPISLILFKKLQSKFSATTEQKSNHLCKTVFANSTDSLPSVES